jgi:hypothetical protein
MVDLFNDSRSILLNSLNFCNSENLQKHITVLD